MNINLGNEKEVIDMLKLKSELIQNNIHKIMPEVGLYLEKEVKESIAGRRMETRSVDTGRLMQNTMSATSSEENTETAIVFNDTEYAEFIEFGTSKITARSHFRNTLEREANYITEKIAEEVRKI